jgi:uncharacterized Zn-binding protein involved in type VI secretion
MKMNRRQFLDLTLVSALGLVLTGCELTPGMTIEDILALLKKRQEEDDNSAENDEGTGDTGPVTIVLTHPAGSSPSVFTSGWVFGASCTKGSEDLSDQVKWGGTASFSPDTGSISRPVFSSEGSNTITIKVTSGGKDYSKSFNVNAISPAGFAAVGDHAVCPADSHGCPACPHPTNGPITSGSPNVFVNGRPAARVGDVGVHAACCGPNSFRISSGTSNVLINGRRAAKIGDATTHCGGTGQIVGGSA